MPKNIGQKYKTLIHTDHKLPLFQKKNNLQNTVVAAWDSLFTGLSKITEKYETQLYYYAHN